jgi:formate-dependent nitrite reductase membrane component NrfD
MATLKVKLGISLAYHPQTDRQTKKINHIIGIYLMAFTFHVPDKWDSLLPLGEFTYNSSIHVSTGKMLFELDLGYTPWLLINLFIWTVLTKVASRAADGLSFVEQMEDNLQITRNSLVLA